MKKSLLPFIGIGIIILSLWGCTKSTEQFKHRRESKEELAMDDRPPRFFNIITNYVFYDKTSVPYGLIYVEGYPEYYPRDEIAFDKEERTVNIKRVNISNASQEAIIRQFFKALEILVRYEGELVYLHRTPTAKQAVDLKILTDPDKYFKNFELAKNQRYEGTVRNYIDRTEPLPLGLEKAIIENLGNLSSFDLLGKMKLIKDAENQGYWVESTDRSGFRMWISDALYYRYGSYIRLRNAKK